MNQMLCEKFTSKYRIDAVTGCHVWSGEKSAKGYGRFRMDGRTIGAHRASWSLNNGAIPDGLWVLHRCDNPPCVNPAHLFLGTAQDNSDDARAKGRLYSQNVTHCPKGHEYTPENTVNRGKNRECRECRKTSTRVRARESYRQKRRQAGFIPKQIKPRTNFTAEAVMFIRENFIPRRGKVKGNRNELAAKFGVAPNTITYTALGIRWQHLPLKRAKCYETNL